MPAFFIVCLGLSAASPCHAKEEPSVPPSPPPARRMAAILPTASYRDAYLTEDTRWQGEVMVDGSVTVAPQTTLTIEPGTIVRFRRGADGRGGALLVFGRLVAKGKHDKEVLFTSVFEEPQPGDWDGILLLGSEKRNLVENSRVTGADVGIDVAYSGVTLQDTSAAGCRIGYRFRDGVALISGAGANSCETGLLAHDSELDLEETDFTSNGRGVVAVGTSLAVTGGAWFSNRETALTVSGGRVRLSGVSFSLNGNGVDFSDCEGRVAVCRMFKNKGFGLHLSRARVRVNGCDLSENGSYGLWTDDAAGTVWGSALEKNGKADLYHTGADELLAVGNWWGGGAPGDRLLLKPGAGGRVRFEPVLKTKPPAAS